MSEGTVFLSLIESNPDGVILHPVYSQPRSSPYFSFLQCCNELLLDILEMGTLRTVAWQLGEIVNDLFREERVTQLHDSCVQPITVHRCSSLMWKHRGSRLWSTIFRRTLTDCRLSLFARPSTHFDPHFNFVSIRTIENKKLTNSTGFPLLPLAMESLKRPESWIHANLSDLDSPELEYLELQSKDDISKR